MDGAAHERPIHQHTHTNACQPKKQLQVEKIGSEPEDVIGECFTFQELVVEDVCSLFQYHAWLLLLLLILLLLLRQVESGHVRSNQGSATKTF